MVTKYCVVRGIHMYAFLGAAVQPRRSATRVRGTGVLQAACILLKVAMAGILK